MDISPNSICVYVLVTQSCPTLCSPWTVVHQAPLSMGFSRQEYWSGVATPFSKGSSQPRDGTRVPCTAGRFLIIWATIVRLSCELANLQFMGSPAGSDSKKSACNAGDPGMIPGSGRSLAKGKPTHSSTLTWRIPWTEEAGELESMGSQRVRHSWVHTHTWDFVSNRNHRYSPSHIIIIADSWIYGSH